MMVTMSWRLTLVQIVAIYFVTVPEYFVNQFLEVCIFSGPRFILRHARLTPY